MGLTRPPRVPFEDGRKKLIYQTPWFEKGEFRGIVELALPIPFEVPHFVRS